LFASAGCSSGSHAPTTLTVATWDIDIGEVYKPSYTDRKTMITAEIPKINADVLCLQGVYRDSDKRALAQAASSAFPYFAWVPTDLATVASDGLSAPGIAPPCNDPSVPNDSTTADAAFACLVANCSTLPGNDSGYVSDESCAANSCVDSVGQLIETAPRCYRCGDMTL
jgi:hypothetical protein